MAPPSLSISSYISIEDEPIMEAGAVVDIMGMDIEGEDIVGIDIDGDDIIGIDEEVIVGIDMVGEEVLMGRKICGSIGAGDGAYSPRWNGSDPMNSSSSSRSSSVNLSKRTAGAGDARMLPPKALRRVNRMSNTMKTYSRSILYALLLR
jgi:hypothetical protein